MTFLVDHQLPPALARWIDSQPGVSAVHVADLNMADASDGEIWRVADERDYILISKDSDFTSLYSKRKSGITRPRLLWVRMRNCRRSVLLHGFERAWPAVMSAFSAGEDFVELR